MVVNGSKLILGQVVCVCFETLGSRCGDNALVLAYRSDVVADGGAAMINAFIFALLGLTDMSEFRLLFSKCFTKLASSPLLVLMLEGI